MRFFYAYYVFLEMLGIKRPFAMRNAFEREDDTELHKALREALVNALIHADYYGRRGIVIKKKRHEIKIANPGICRPEITEIFEGNVSDPRNPILFKMFAMIDLCERSGSGVFNLVKLWEKAGWEKPNLHTDFDTDRTTLTIPVIVEEKSEDSTNQGFKDTNDTNNDTNDTNDTNDDVKRTNRILSLLINNNKISTKEIANILNISVITVKRSIAQLKESGIVERIDGTRGYWKITKQ
jgi:predicted HTH transcriptional regulator